jgi:hypothetical protein
MRVQKRNPWLTSLGVVLAVIALMGGRAAADVASDQAGSIVIFPKVIADGTRDTIISLTNTSNMQAFVHCEYVQGTGICSNSPLDAPVFCTPLNTAGASPDCTSVPGEICEGIWQSQNFDLILTRQQPTFWRVSTGRVFDLKYDEDACEIRNIGGVDRQVCSGFFFTNLTDPLNPTGNVLPPPGAPFFRGELKCFQADSAIEGVMAGDALKGEAMIETIGSPVISKYNSINIQGEAGSSDLVLRLNQTPNTGMGVGEFNACPEALEFTSFSDQADNPIANAIQPADCTVSGCPVRTEITVIPCSQDFELEVGERTNLFFQFYDEFEDLQNSFTVELNCWGNYDLGDLTTVTNTSTFWKTRITPIGSGRCKAGIDAANPLCLGPQGECRGAPCANDAACGTGGVCGPVSSILAIVEEFYETDATVGGLGIPGSAAFNTTMINNDSDPDVARSGRCRGNIGQSCQVDGDCGATGICRNSSTSCTTDANCTTGVNDICDRCMFDEIIFNSLQ